jgi:endonuclease YncB( thermonuclease family)
MKSVRTLIATVLCVLALTNTEAFSHGVVVDEDGCHTDGKTGKQHCHPGRASAHPQPTFDAAHPPRIGDERVLYGPLVRVRDGDTLEVKIQGFVMDFRIAEVDAPEHDQPYGAQARSELLALVRGKTVVLLPIDTDRYGRTVAHVWVGDVDVGRELVKRGAAWFYDEYATDATLYELERIARDAARGLWALPKAERIEPWVWRRERR